MRLALRFRSAANVQCFEFVLLFARTLVRDVVMEYPRSVEALAHQLGPGS